MPPKQRPNRVAAPNARRRPSTPLLLGLVVAAIAVTAVAITLSLTLGGGHRAPVVPTSESIVAGIAQHGLVLGNPKARVTLTEYIDTSCPICKEYARTTFPSIVKTYVRTGKVKIEAQPLGIVGPSSERGRQLLLAAARQGRAWNLAEVVYANQGNETTAWLTDAVTKELADQVAGLDLNTLLADSTSAETHARAARIDAQAQADGVTGTPAFVLTTADGQRHLLGAGNPGYAAFADVLDRALSA